MLTDKKPRCPYCILGDEFREMRVLDNGRQICEHCGHIIFPEDRAFLCPVQEILIDGRQFCLEGFAEILENFIVSAHAGILSSTSASFNLRRMQSRIQIADRARAVRVGSVANVRCLIARAGRGARTHRALRTCRSMSAVILNLAGAGRQLRQVLPKVRGRHAAGYASDDSAVARWLWRLSHAYCHCPISPVLRNSSTPESAEGISSRVRGLSRVHVQVTGSWKGADGDRRPERSGRAAIGFQRSHRKNIPEKYPEELRDD